MNKQQHALNSILRKLSIFKDLEADHIQRLARLSTSKVFEAGQVIYEEGSPSDEMLVLLQGRIIASSRGGAELAEIEPGTSTGEMGVLTDQPRSAKITAIEKCIAVVFSKTQMTAALSSNSLMSLRLHANMVKLISDRLTAANNKIDELQKRLMILEEMNDDGDEVEDGPEETEVEDGPEETEVTEEETEDSSASKEN
jgi:CRP-like cAMP-binding protein